MGDIIQIYGSEEVLQYDDIINQLINYTKLLFHLIFLDTLTETGEMSDSPLGSTAEQGPYPVSEDIEPPTEDIVQQEMATTMDQETELEGGVHGSSSREIFWNFLLKTVTLDGYNVFSNHFMKFS